MLAIALTACKSGGSPQADASTPGTRMQSTAAAVRGDENTGAIAITTPTPSASLPAGLPLPTCAEVRADGPAGDALVEAFGARYPKVLVSPDTVETVALDRAAVDNAVDYIACVASATDFDPMVAENSLALFASHRHGKAALARLATLGRTGDPAAQEFKEQIKGYLAGPGK